MQENGITFSALCNYLARSPAFVRQVQNKLGLPVLEDDGYPATYVAFMETVLYLRIMGIRLEDIFDLFEIEKKILKLLKLDALSGSRLWYLDRCGVQPPSSKHLLLTHYEISHSVNDKHIQYNLDFAQRDAELFTSQEMGEDMRRVFRHYMKLRKAMIARLKIERPRVKSAVEWAARAIR
jgi:hypothetical protein